MKIKRHEWPSIEPAYAVSLPPVEHWAYRLALARTIPAILAGTGNPGTGVLAEIENMKGENHD